MIQDLRQLEDGQRLDADVVVIGGGVAGITLACELAETRLSVVVAESGGFEFEAETQALYEGAIVGVPYWPLDVTRLRYFGGSSNHWMNRCSRLMPHDLAARPWIPHSGWPFAWSELAPFYRRAHPYASLGPANYDPDHATLHGEVRAGRRLDGIEDVVFHDVRNPTRFGEVYRAKLERAANIRVLLHANVTALRAAHDARRIERVEARTLEGRRVELRGRLYVLACGGLENPRLLLASNDVAPNGLGNGHDLVGRFFMDHPETRTAMGVTLDSTAWIEAYRYWPNQPGEVARSLMVSPEKQQEFGLGNISFKLIVTDEGAATGRQALRHLLKRLRGKEVDGSLSGDLGLAITDIDDTLAGIYGYVRNGFHNPPAAAGQSFALIAEAELAPDPDNRVTLTNERDALGMPRIALKLRPSPLDLATLKRGTELTAAELTRGGLARVRFPDWMANDDPGWGENVLWGHHHMGTTRMSADPKRGVVDPHCQVHGMENLYVAGSSVFATSGAVNPTLTIIALTLRLADHLKGALIA
jgi:choline dehydrogenase-like flavoprotein